MRRVSRLQGTAWAVVLGAGTVWVIALTPLRSTEGFALLVALPGRPMALTLLGLAIGFGWAARQEQSRMQWLALSTAALMVCCLFIGRAVAQGLSNAVPAASAPALRALSWNTQGVDPGTIADRVDEVIRERSIDLIVMPEGLAHRVAENLDHLGWSNLMFRTEETAVIMRADLAREAGYKVISGNPPWAGVAITPTTPTAATPIIVAVHIQQPSPGNVEVRNEHLDWVHSLCDGSDYVLAVGDFNSTVNHLYDRRIGACVDVASSVGAGAASTWPTWLPSWAGISIDRALVSPPYVPELFGFEVLHGFDTSGSDGWGSGRGSDHWPILIEVPGEG